MTPPQTHSRSITAGMDCRAVDKSTGCDSRRAMLQPRHSKRRHARLANLQIDAYTLEWINERVDFLLYYYPRLSKLSDPDYRLWDRLRSAFIEILKLSNQLDGGHYYKGVDKEISQAVMAIIEIMPQTIQGIPESQKQIQEISELYKDNEVSDLHIHRKLGSVVDSLPNLGKGISTLFKALDQLRESLRRRQAREVQIEWAKTGVWMILISMVLLSSFFGIFPGLYRDAFRAYYVSMILKAVWEMSVGEPRDYVSKSKPLYTKLESSIEDLTFNLHVLLRTFDEVETHILTLREKGTSYWDARVEGALRAYVDNFELEYWEIVSLRNTFGSSQVRRLSLPAQ